MNTPTKINIRLKMPQERPEDFENLLQFILIGVPQKDPETKSFMRMGGMSPEQLADTGAWLIQVAGALKQGKEPPPMRSLPDPNKRIGNRIIQP